MFLLLKGEALITKAFLNMRSGTLRALMIRLADEALAAAFSPGVCACSPNRRTPAPLQHRIQRSNPWDIPIDAIAHHAQAFSAKRGVTGVTWNACADTAGNSAPARGAAARSGSGTCVRNSGIGLRHRPHGRAGGLRRARTDRAALAEQTRNAGACLPNQKFAASKSTENIEPGVVRFQVRKGRRTPLCVPGSPASINWARLRACK